MNDKTSTQSTSVSKVVGRRSTDRGANVFEERLKVLTSSVKDIHASLVSGPLARNKLPEDIFKNYFLPMFAGLETHPDVTVGMWASIAGTPFAEVDIVDSNGQVLFTVPPVLERNIVDPTKPNNVPLGVVTDTVEKMLKQSPARATAFLMHHLDQITLEEQVLSKFQQSNFSRLDEIFRRYDVTPSWGFASNASNDSQTQGGKKTDKMTMSVDEDIL